MLVSGRLAYSGECFEFDPSCHWGVNGIYRILGQEHPPLPIYLNSQNMKSNKRTSKFRNKQNLFIFVHIFEKQNNPSTKMLDFSNLAFLDLSQPSPIDQPAIITSMAGHTSPWCPGTAHRRWALVLLAPNHVPGTVWFGPPNSRWSNTHRGPWISRKWFFQFTRKDLVLHNIWGVTFSFSETLSWGATLSKQVGQVMSGNSCSIPKKGLSIESHKHHTSDDC